METITVPVTAVMDKQLSKNSLRLYMYALLLKAAKRNFTLIEGLGEIQMSYQTYANARNALLAHGYFKFKDEARHQSINWELNEERL